MKPPPRAGKRKTTSYSMLFGTKQFERLRTHAPTHLHKVYSQWHFASDTEEVFLARGGQKRRPPTAGENKPPAHGESKKNTRPQQEKRPTHPSTHPPTHPTLARHAFAASGRRKRDGLAFDPFFKSFLRSRYLVPGIWSAWGHPPTGQWMCGCVGAKVCGCVGAWVPTHPHPPPTHPQRSAHPTHLPTYLPTYKPLYRFTHRSWVGNFFPPGAGRTRTIEFSVGT